MNTPCQMIAVAGLPVVLVGMLEPSPTAMIVGAGMLGLPAVIESGGKGQRQAGTAVSPCSPLGYLRGCYVRGEISLYEFERQLLHVLPEPVELFPLVGEG